MRWTRPGLRLKEDTIENEGECHIVDSSDHRSTQLERNPQMRLRDPRVSQPCLLTFLEICHRGERVTQVLNPIPLRAARPTAAAVETVCSTHTPKFVHNDYELVSYIFYRFRVWSMQT